MAAWGLEGCKEWRPFAGAGLAGQSQAMGFDEVGEEEDSEAAGLSDEQDEDDAKIDKYARMTLENLDTKMINLMQRGVRTLESHPVTVDPFVRYDP